MREPRRYVIGEESVLDESGAVWARVWRGNPLEVGVEGEGRVVAWSGWLGEEAGGVFERDFRVWTPGAWKQLRERIDEWLGTRPSRGGTVARGGSQDALILRPHARHVLSDAQACALLLREVQDERVMLLLDPVSMLEPGMLRDAEDHVARVLQLARWDRVAGVVIQGAGLVGEDLRPSRSGGAISRDRIEALVNHFAPETARFHLA